MFYTFRKRARACATSSPENESLLLCVECESLAEAESRAVYFGADFNIIVDCDCCVYPWYRPSESDTLSQRASYRNRDLSYWGIKWVVFFLDGNMRCSDAVPLSDEPE